MLCFRNVQMSWYHFFQDIWLWPVWRLYLCALTTWTPQITGSTSTEVDSSICSVWVMVGYHDQNDLHYYNAFVYIRGWYHLLCIRDSWIEMHQNVADEAITFRELAYNYALSKWRFFGTNALSWVDINYYIVSGCKLTRAFWFMTVDRSEEVTIFRFANERFQFPFPWVPPFFLPLLHLSIMNFQQGQFESI